MQKVSLGLFAVLACTWGCDPLANDPVAKDGGGGGTGGGGDAGAHNPLPGHDSGAVTASDAGQGGQGDDGGAQGDDGAAPESGSTDTGTVPPVDSAPPPPACSQANAAWVAGAGIASTGWKATATATANNDGTLTDATTANAFDGSITTRWSDGLAQAGGEFFRLDLGQSQSISQVVYFDTTDIPAAYTLALSADDVTYTTVATGAGAQPTAICFPAQAARYIKLTQTGASGSWLSIYEIQVFH